jgi:hypothetical protein
VENTICKISKNEPETLLNYLENINRTLLNSNMIQVQKDMNIIHITLKIKQAFIIFNYFKQEQYKIAI